MHAPDDPAKPPPAVMTGAVSGVSLNANFQLLLAPEMTFTNLLSRTPSSSFAASASASDAKHMRGTCAGSRLIPAAIDRCVHFTSLTMFTGARRSIALSARGLVQGTGRTRDAVVRPGRSVVLGPNHRREYTALGSASLGHQIGAARVYADPRNSRSLANDVFFKDALVAQWGEQQDRARGGWMRESARRGGQDLCSRCSRGTRGRGSTCWPNYRVLYRCGEFSPRW